MKHDWSKIKRYYITHEKISLEELAKKYKVSISTLNKRCRKEGWVEQKKKKCQEIDNKVTEKITEQIIDRKTKANERHNELFDKCLDVAEKILNKYMAELESGKKKTSANAYNLDFLTKSISNAQKGQRLSLNIEADEQTSDTEPEVMVIKGLDLRKI